MKAYVRLSNAGIGVLSALLFEAGSAGGVNASSAVGFGTQLSSDAAAGQWPSTPFSYTFPPGTLASYVSIRLAPSPAWNGTMYIDTVQISP